LGIAWGLAGRALSVARRRTKAVGPALAALRRRSTLSARSARTALAGSATREAQAAEPAGGANAAACLHDFVNALGDGFPLGVILYVELLAHPLGHALAHLLGIEVARLRAILRLSVARADNQPGGRSQRAGYD